MVTDSLHVDAEEALSIRISILIFGLGQDPYVRTINAPDNVWEAGLCIKPSFYGRPGIGGYWPPNEMLRLSNNRIWSVTSLTVLETVLLLNLTENDNGMVVISFKLEANQSCYNQINLGVMFDQFYKRKQF